MSIFSETTYEEMGNILMFIDMQITLITLYII